jgi:hypothetical protein
MLHWPIINAVLVGEKKLYSKTAQTTVLTFYAYDHVERSYDAGTIEA